MSSTTQQGRRERRLHETRQRLLAAALDLFATQGYTATTFDHIAARADVGRQTAFNHFRRKEDFVVAWVRQRHQHLNRHDAAHPSRRASAVELLTSQLRTLAEFNEHDYALAKDLYDSGVLHSAFAAGAPTPDAFLAAVTRGRQSGEIRQDIDAELVADMVFDTYTTTLARWLKADGAFPLGETLATKLGILVTGIAAPPADAATSN
ncbi:TetR/AcrR family transcriptional regulator [Streptomyces sp. NPDC059152]|uniref:TetR/AcrR family transcriptional regulator n=1 Tax=Streptomyces sp. NPDC059152 TaxID=3346742 RepID=UPI0036833B7B